MKDELLNARIRKFAKNTPSQSTKLTLEELFDKQFMIKYTSFSSIFDFFKAGGFDVKSVDDIKNIKPELDEYIKNTQPALQNWDNMKYGALKAYSEKILKK